MHVGLCFCAGTMMRRGIFFDEEVCAEVQEIVLCADA